MTVSVLTEANGRCRFLRPTGVAGLACAGERRWFILLAPLVLGSFAVFRYRDVRDLWGGSALDAQVFYQVSVWSVLCGLALYCSYRGRTRWSLVCSGPLCWFAAYSILGLCSAVYSPAPLFTAFRGMQLLVALILVVSLRDYRARLLEFIVIWLAINWSLVLVGYFGLDQGVPWIRGPNDAYVAYEGTEIEAWRFASAFGHPATLSIVTSLAAIALAQTIDRGNWRWTLPLLLWFVVTNVLTVGRVGLASMMIGLCIVAIARRCFFAVICMALVAGAIILMSGNMDDQLAAFLARGQTTEELEELNGRAGIYATALERAAEAPLVGYGYRSGRVQIYNEGSSTVHAHNAFLESYMGLGLLGLFLTVATLVSALRRSWMLFVSSRRSPIARNVGLHYFALMIPVVAFSITETGLAADISVPALCFLIVFAAFESAWQAIRSDIEIEAAGIKFANGREG